jgi:hypothetical protein
LIALVKSEIASFVSPLPACAQPRPKYASEDLGSNLIAFLKSLIALPTPFCVRAIPRPMYADVFLASNLMALLKSAIAPLASPVHRFMFPRAKYAIAIRGSDRIALLMSASAPLLSPSLERARARS